MWFGLWRHDKLRSFKPEELSAYKFAIAAFPDCGLSIIREYKQYGLWVSGEVKCLSDFFNYLEQCKSCIRFERSYRHTFNLKQAKKIPI